MGGKKGRPKRVSCRRLGFGRLTVIDGGGRDVCPVTVGLGEQARRGPLGRPGYGSGLPRLSLGDESRLDFI